MGIAEIISLIGLVIKYEPVIAADIVALGNLLFHAQANSEPPIDLVARAQSIQARIAAVAQADSL